MIQLEGRVMRLWSLHPQYLDSKGLVALWRETLLAQKVLLGLTRGYTRHPQLTRFRQHPKPVAAIASYLRQIHKESQQRGYQFDAGKIHNGQIRNPLTVTQGQIDYEWQHLLQKLQLRDPERYEQLRTQKTIIPNPLFIIVPGDIEPWEIL